MNIQKKLAEAVGKKLSQEGLTIALAESCTGGLISHSLTNVPGSSAYLKGSVVAYANEIKVSLLKVPLATIKQKGAVCEEVARAMARGIKKIMQSDIGVGVTGIAGPSGGTKEKPLGLVYIAVTSDTKDICEKHLFPGNREKVKEETAQTAFKLVEDIIS